MTRTRTPAFFIKLGRDYFVTWNEQTPVWLYVAGVVLSCGVPNFDVVQLPHLWSTWGSACKDVANWWSVLLKCCPSKCQYSCRAAGEKNALLWRLTALLLTLTLSKTETILEKFSNNFAGPTVQENLNLQDFFQLFDTQATRSPRLIVRHCLPS